ncbi:MAG: hypothetical protein HY822_10225 [Acidobacteria bacterium]|nr:hypothetical protein [Acidobacteriota bacterium]
MTPRLRISTLLLLAPLAMAADLFRDDFSRFPPRIFSEPVKQLTNAIQEYHYLPHRGVPVAPWEDAICHDDVWAGGDEDGKTYLEQHTVNSQHGRNMNPLMIAGDPEWFDYTLEVKVRAFSNANFAGLAFRYRTNRHYYLFALTGGNRAVLRLRLPYEKKTRIAEWKELGAAEFAYDSKRYYTLKVENDGPKIRAFIDGKLLVEATDGEILKGKVGVTSNIPARFTGVRVSAADGVEKQIRARIAAREAELAKLRAANPKPKLWKKFDTPRFGAGRNVRFGDLDGDGKLDMLIAQNVRKASKNSFDHISCLTALNLDGKVLWQVGRPDPYNDTLANDTPFQIHDIDGDGASEVVMVKDFKIQILEGQTGKVKKWVWMPEAPKDNKDRPYELEVGDSIYFADFAGRKAQREIVVKDRYRTFWVFDSNLKQLWWNQCNTGHFPYSLDTDGDGREEMVIGYSMFAPDGKKLWSLDEQVGDHSDGIVLGNFSGNPKGPIRSYMFASDEGFIMSNLKGQVEVRVRAGHTQSPSVAKYRPELAGLQLMSINFWRNPGIVTLFDPEGRVIEQGEPIHSGSPILPVNWRGDGQEFAMLSASVKEGGMIDGHLRRVVMFPDDGHPDLACNVLDLTGDRRDEIVVWDSRRVWIYTQDRLFPGDRIYAPRRNPDWNESNYRVNVSMPAWQPVRR